MRRCRVVKVGGSLLEWPALSRQLSAWLDAQSALPSLFLVGGGALADAVRQLDRCCDLPAAAVHWMAIRAMEVNSLVLRELLSNAHGLASVHAWHEQLPTGDRANEVLMAEHFLQHEEPFLAGDRLPCGWHVTSDSIAARVADVCQARELVLLKSTLPARCNPPLSLRDLAQAGLIDEYFPIAAASLPSIRLVNLRASDFPEITIVK
jgi:aspartokinase-like uncharacterized kinase